MAHRSDFRKILLQDIIILEPIALKLGIIKIQLAEICGTVENSLFLDYIDTDSSLPENPLPLVPDQVIIGLITADPEEVGSILNINLSVGVFQECILNENRIRHFVIYRLSSAVTPVTLMIGVRDSGPFSMDELENLGPVLSLFDLSVGREFSIRQLLVEKNRYNQLYSAAPEAIATLDHDNCIQDVNPEFEKLFQYKKEQILGKNLDQLLTSGNLLTEAEHYTAINWEGGHVAFESQRRRRDGSLIDVSILGVPFDQGNGDLFIYAIYRDISERKRNEKQKLSRIEFIEYMSSHSAELINLEIESIDQSIEQALEKVGKLYNAERAYLVTLADDGNSIGIRHEWTVDHRFSHRERQPYILVNEITDYLSHLRTGEAFYLQRSEVGSRAGTAELNFFFDLLDIESMVNIPLFVGLGFRGYIGFDTYSRPAEWDEQAINSFKLTGQILINALARKQTEQDFKEAFKKAEASDKLKSAFLAGISHEVRTPMNHILGFLELLNEPDLSFKDKDEYIGIMKSSGMHLLRLIDHVIELAMIDSGHVRIKERPCDISRLMESLLIEFEGVKSEMNRSEVELRLRIMPECRQLTVQTDEIRLRQILWNLLSNALKYTPRGRVDFGFGFSDNNRLEFFVSDTGIGIDIKNMEFIFDRFRQADDGYSREYGGAGLGLSISQGLAVLFGSRITVQSTVGSGSAFRFSIPYNEYKTVLNGFDKDNGTSDRVSWDNKSILMVEDDPVNMRFLTVLLLRTGANLLYASNGLEAIEIVKNNPVDLILMDMQMPVMDGFIATRILKGSYPAIPVLAQTACSLREEKSECMAAGCDDFISKPIDKNNLYQKVDRLLKMQG